MLAWLHRAWTWGSTYDWRAAIGTLSAVVGFLLSDQGAALVPAPYLPYVKTVSAALALLGIVLAAQGKPLVKTPE